MKINIIFVGRNSYFLHLIDILFHREIQIKTSRASCVRSRDQSFPFQKIRDSIFHFRHDPNISWKIGKIFKYVQSTFGKRDRVLSYLKKIFVIQISVVRFYSP